jgi:hypothetical protein
MIRFTPLRSFGGLVGLESPLLLGVYFSLSDPAFVLLYSMNKLQDIIQQTMTVIKPIAKPHIDWNVPKVHSICLELMDSTVPCCAICSARMNNIWTASVFSCIQSC